MDGSGATAPRQEEIRMRRISLLALVGAFLLIPASLAIAGQAKTELCHANSNGYQLISIAEPAVDAHIAHGDASPGEPVPGMDGYEFDATCEPVPVNDLIFAVAYMDVVDDGQSYDASVDVLIAKFVDANSDGLPSVGDKVVTAHYPSGLDFPLDGYGDFALTEFEASIVVPATPTVFAPDGEICGVRDSTGRSFLWQHEYMAFASFNKEYESYSEYFDVSNKMTTFHDQILDWDLPDVEDPDQMRIDTESPSQPADALDWTQLVRQTDDPFIDVEMNCVIP
jgi:hypothetical protein